MHPMIRGAVLATAFLATIPAASRGADHADTPNLTAISRHDGRLTDLHVFMVGQDLVLSLSTNPNIGVGVADYTFPADVTFRIHLDRRPVVAFDDSPSNETYGGMLRKPHRVKPDVTFTVTFPSGSPVIAVDGARIGDGQMQVFAGLRDDPFIRGPRQGRNIAAIVLQLPLQKVLGDSRSSNRVLAVWATSDVPNINGSTEEHAGRALRSQFPGSDVMNNLPPSMHSTMLGMVPDVVLYDTSRPAGYPNGRLLTDDVVDLVGEPTTLASDAPFPSVNDKAFLSNFPYLAEPW